MDPLLETRRLLIIKYQQQKIHDEYIHCSLCNSTIRNRFKNITDHIQRSIHHDKLKKIENTNTELTQNLRQNKRLLKDKIGSNNIYNGSVREN